MVVVYVRACLALFTAHIRLCCSCCCHAWRRKREKRWEVGPAVVAACTPTQLGYNYTKNTWHRPAYIRALQPVPDVYRRTHMTAPVSFLSHVEHAYMHAWTYTIVISFFPYMYVTKAHVSPYMYFLFLMLGDTHKYTWILI